MMMMMRGSEALHCHLQHSHLWIQKGRLIPVDAFQRAQNFEDMEELFEELKLKGHAPDNVTNRILLGAYERMRRLDKAREFAGGVECIIERV